MGLSGLAARGAQESLEKMLEQALAKEQLDQSGRMQQQRIDQDARQFDESQALQAEEFGFNKDRATKQDERQYETDTQQAMDDMRRFNKGFDERMIATDERQQNRDWQQGEPERRKAEAEYRAKLEDEYGDVNREDEQAHDIALEAMRERNNRTPSGGATAIKAQQASQAAMTLLTKIDTLSKGIIGNATGIMARGAGMARSGQSMVGMNDDVDTYNGLIGISLPMIARELGHVGVLTQQDVESVEKGLPVVSGERADTVGARQQKMDNIKDLISRRIKEYEATNGVSLGGGGAADAGGGTDAASGAVQWTRDPKTGRPVPRK